MPKQQEKITKRKRGGDNDELLKKLSVLEKKLGKVKRQRAELEQQRQTEASHKKTEVNVEPQQQKDPDEKRQEPAENIWGNMEDELVPDKVFNGKQKYFNKEGELVYVLDTVTSAREYFKNGKIISKKQLDGKENKYKYDKEGNLTFIDYYDNEGNLESTFNPQNEATYFYKEGKIMRVIGPNGEDLTETQPAVKDTEAQPINLEVSKELSAEETPPILIEKEPETENRLSFLDDFDVPTGKNKTNVDQLEEIKREKKRKREKRMQDLLKYINKREQEKAEEASSQPDTQPKKEENVPTMVLSNTIEEPEKKSRLREWWQGVKEKRQQKKLENFLKEKEEGQQKQQEQLPQEQKRRFERTRKLFESWDEDKTKKVLKTCLGAALIGGASLAGANLLGVGNITLEKAVGRLSLRTLTTGAITGGAILAQKNPSEKPSRISQFFADHEKLIRGGSIGFSLGLTFILSGGTTALISAGWQGTKLLNEYVVKRTKENLETKLESANDQEEKEKIEKNLARLNRYRSVFTLATTLASSITVMASSQGHQETEAWKKGHENYLNNPSHKYEVEKDTIFQKAHTKGVNSELDKIEKLKKTVMEEYIKKDQVVQKGEGVIHALTRDIENKMLRDPEFAKKIGYTGGLKLEDAEAMHKFAQEQAFLRTKEAGYIGENGKEIWVSEPNKTSYEILDNGGIKVSNTKTGDYANLEPGKSYNPDKSFYETLHSKTPETLENQTSIPNPENRYEDELANEYLTRRIVEEHFKDDIAHIIKDSKLNSLRLEDFNNVIQRGKATDLFNLERGDLNPSYKQLWEYLHKLEKITGIKPDAGNSLRPAETNNDYIKRALEKASLLGKLDQINF